MVIPVPFWTADSVSAAGTLLSVVVAVGVFIGDRWSASERRKADAARLMGLIAGDVGLAIPKIRTLSGFINSQAQLAGYDSAVELLEVHSDIDSRIESVLQEFDTARIERICETAGVFTTEVSRQLSLLGMLRAGALQSVRILAESSGVPERQDVALNVARQVNMLQKVMVDIFNATIAQRGVSQGQASIMISGT